MEQEIRDALSASDHHRAFKLIVETYDQRLYWHIRRMLDSHEDSDDVLQECFIKVWKYLPSFRGDSSIYTWVYRIATNESLTFIKKRKRLQGSDIEQHEQVSRLQGDTYFDEKAAQAKFEMAISRLPEKQKLVFNMKYFEEMKYEDMAEVLETSVGALKASYHHAVKKLREMLSED